MLPRADSFGPRRGHRHRRDVLFGLAGLVAPAPFLWRPRRRFGTWRAPAIGLALFAATFFLSAFVIGPAISGPAGAGTSGGEQPAPDEHSSHH